MITETGRVVVVEPDCLWVETIRRSACDSCAAEKGCGQRLAARLGQAHSSFLRVLLEERDADDYRVDDEVTIGIPEAVVANSSLVAYLLPLVALVGGVLLGDALFASEGAVMLMALAGFGVGALGVIGYAHLHRNDSRYQPFLVDASTPLQWHS